MGKRFRSLVDEKSDKNSTEVKSMNNASGNIKETNVYVPMVKVRINNAVEAWALLDTGSTNSFITEKLATQLKLKGTPIKYQVSTLDSTKDKCSQLVKFDIADPEQSFSLSAVMVIIDIPGRYPPMALDLDSYPQFKSVCLPSLVRMLTYL